MKKFLLIYDITLMALLLVGIIIAFGGVNYSFNNTLIFLINLSGLLPVMFSAIKAAINKQVTVDLLASFALILSIMLNENVSSIFINLMLTSARLLDHYVQFKADRSLAGLLKLRPKTAKVKEDGKVITRDISMLKVGDIICVELGERLPIDGKIISGGGSVDQSTLTGESIPVEKKVGDDVISSTLLSSGYIEVRAEKVGQDTTLEKILKLVDDAQLNKAASVSFADSFSQFYILAIIIVAVFIFILSGNINLILSVILVVCADDIAVAIPLAFLGGIRAASRFGVIIKGGKYIEELSKVEIMVIDKTGTITEGKLGVNAYFTDQNDKQILNILASLTHFSEHPVSKSINAFSLGKGGSEQKIENFQEKGGIGISAKLDGEKYYLGREALISGNGITISEEFTNKVARYISEGNSITLLANDKNVLAIISLQDFVKPNIKFVIKNFYNRGVKRIIMLTGDNETVASNVCQSVGIKEFHANLLPQDKVKFVGTLVDQKHNVVMVGDGVNDAAALSLANVGIAMGAIGSDITLDSADVILADDKLEKVSFTIDLSHFIISVSMQNFVIWAVVNMIGLYLVFTGILNPPTAAFFNFITDFIPLANALRVFWWRPVKY